MRHSRNSEQQITISAIVTHSTTTLAQITSKGWREWGQGVEAGRGEGREAGKEEFTFESNFL